MKKSENIQKTEILIFVILLFLQNFAIITTKSFGIAGITVFLLYTFIRYKMYLKIDKKTIIFTGVVFAFILLSQLLNNAFKITQIVRYAMVFFIAWTSIKYIKIIYENNNKNFFETVFFFALMVITTYGVYQFIACKLQMPNILNLFSNNPSYGARGIFESYGGWTNDIRIYTTFYEPSSYALFLTIAYFYVLTFKSIDKEKKFAITALALFNLFFTFSRSGWVTFIYFVGIYIMFKILKNNSILKKIGKVLIVLLPLITLVVMSTLGIIVFRDISSNARTYSSLYYLTNSFDSIKSIVIGHGLGSMLDLPEGTRYNDFPVENFAHNGYIDIIYQLGMPFFILALYAVVKYLKEKNIDDEWLICATIFTLCCFGSMYNVESIMVMVCIVIVYYEHIHSTKSKKEEYEEEIELNINKNETLVSICSITYNQENYIRQALDSFINQKTNFKYEIIIHDDASTDNTAKIIKEYEEKYPNIVRGIYEKENQYSKGNWTLIKTCREAKGKYIAICEGDDFWTDENKLQKQVNYMETHPKCTLCFHNATILNMDNPEEKELFIPQNNDVVKYLKEDNTYNVGELELLDFIPTASFMFRTETLSKLPDWFEKCFVQDWPLKLVMTSFGYAYFMDKPMSTYRKNATGSVTNDNAKKEKESLDGKKYILNRKKEFIDWIDEFTKGQYKEVFDLRRNEYEVERLMAEGKKDEILKNKYLESFDTKKRVKYLIKIYCPGVVKLYKKIKR